MRKVSSFTLVELLTVMCVIFVLLGVFAIYAKITLRVARETALRAELSNIRTSIEHYLVVRKSLPPDLGSLMNQTFTFKTPDGIIIKQRFLDAFRVDAQGYLIDPFFKRYMYDNKSGWVHTSTAAYQNW